MGIEQPNEFLDKLQDPARFSHQVVHMRNALARKQTRWNVTENKLFVCALSQINEITSEGWVKLNKNDVVNTLRLGSGHTGAELRAQCESMAGKSWIRFGNDENWDDGFLINRIKSDKKEIYVKFDKAYIDYLKEVGKQWTTFQIGDISLFKSKYSIVLFQYLRSWYNPQYGINSQAVSLIKMKEIFNIQADQYVRKSGPNKGKFDTSNFKKRTIDKAISEINNIAECHMFIDCANVIRQHGCVWGYEFKFSLLDDSGARLMPEDM